MRRGPGLNAAAGEPRRTEGSVPKLLEEGFEQFYLTVRKNYYKRIAAEVGTSRNSLTATECFCLEIILLMDNPNISMFADFLNISLPNATYRIRSLIRKGYVSKSASKSDRREVRIAVTDKYRRFYGMNNPDIHKIIETVEERLSPEELVQLTGTLGRINALIGPAGKGNGR
ncbi:MAG: MarR family transcriptional regulator [Clostridia bacterium]|nr:MarR family transcriptional regulator [Clostridia bacterium]